MKIKNKKSNRRFFGFRTAKPGFTLEPGEVSKDLPATVALEVTFKLILERDEIDVTLTDNDRRLLGEDTLKALGLSKKKKKKTEPKVAIPAEVKEQEEVPEEPVVEKEPGVCEDMPVADEPAEEPVVEENLETPDPEADEKVEEPGFSLPKPPSKMNKADWLSVGMMEEVGLKNEINPGMTKTKLQEAVMGRLEELGLAD